MLVVSSVVCNFPGGMFKEQSQRTKLVWLNIYYQKQPNIEKKVCLMSEISKVLAN